MKLLNMEELYGGGKVVRNLQAWWRMYVERRQFM
jgi:hypothetical protein